MCVFFVCSFQHHVNNVYVKMNSFRPCREAWSKRVHDLPSVMSLLVDCIVSAAMLTYSGTLPNEQRYTSIHTLIHVYGAVYIRNTQTHYRHYLYMHTLYSQPYTHSSKRYTCYYL